jgi:hypothetical protein
MATLDIIFEDQYAGTEERYRLEGDPDESLLTVLRRSVTANAKSPEWHVALPATPSYHFPVKLTVGPEATFGRSVEFFGAHTPVRIQNGGVGGGGGFPDLVEALRGAAEVIGYISLALAARRAAMAAYYREHHEAARNWRESSLLTRELKDLVYEWPAWRREQFDEQFGLEEDGPRLLRELGYQRRDQDGEEWWWRTEVDN